MSRMLGYTRVSTADQDCAGQQTQIQQAAARRDWQLLEILTDHGESAKSLDRPALQTALKQIADREADGLIVAKLDRLTRSVIDFASLLDWFGQANATLVALDLDIDTSTAGGRLVANVFAAVAEWERETIRERTRASLAEIRRQGRSISGPAVQDRPEVAETIQAMREQGSSLREICVRLEELKISTARGGSEWRPSAVQTILGYKRPRRRARPCLPELR